MKKLGFKVLCMVLVMALLSPNVFAATPAPEVPLADAATVERVKQEIAVGQITDMEDLFLVAYQHLGADLEEEGMTAYINEDGTLGFTQIVSNGNSNGDVSLCSTDNGVEEITYAVTTMALIDNEGNLLTDYESYYISPDYAYGGAAAIAISATHTAYYNGRASTNGWYTFYEIQISHMVTSFSCADGNHYITQVDQEYKYFPEFTFEDIYTESDAKTTYCSQVAGSYSFTPSSRGWHSDDSGTGRIETYATIYLAGTDETICLTTINQCSSNTD